MAERPELPHLDLLNFKGLFTKSSTEVVTAEQLRVAENCDYFDTYGAVTKMRGSARVLTTRYTESGAVKPISWVGFYKASALDGPLLRHTLVSAGTVLGRVDSGAVTTLASGRTNNLVHQGSVLDRFMYITNYDPDLVGVGDKLVKYDGAVITNWGITPPGSQETVREAFGDASSFSTFNSTAADQVSTTTGDVTWDGEAVKTDKSGTADGTFSIEKDMDTAFLAQGDVRDSNDAIANRVNFFTFIPRGELTATNLDATKGFNQSPAMSIWVSPDTGSVETNAWRFYFPIGAFVEGWNKISLNFTGGEPQPGKTPEGFTYGHFYPETEPIARMRWEFEAQKPATSLTGIRVDRLQTLDEGAPVVNESGTADPVFSASFIYSYKITFVSKYGNESNTGPQSRNFTIATTGSDQLDLTSIPVSSDEQVVARRLYRTVGNGSIWLFLDEIFDNETTVYTDIVPDGSLGDRTAPQAGDFSDDNSIPPMGGIIKEWRRTIFMAGDPQNPTILYYSEDNEPESFPLINTFELDDKITAIYETYSGLVVETETAKWQVLGDNPDFSLDKIVPEMGCVGRRAAGTARRTGYAVDREGMRTFDLSNVVKISEPIRDKYDSDISKPFIENIHTIHSKARNFILQFNPDSSGKFSSIFGYIYPIDDVNQGRWTNITLPTDANSGDGLNFLHATEIEDSNGDFRIYAGAEDGMLYELFTTTSKNWVDAGGTEYAVEMQFQTPYLRLGELGKEIEGVGGRFQPQFIELRVKGDAATWNVTWDMADGSKQEIPRDTKTVAMVFGANNSLLRYPLPEGNVVTATYGRLTISNTQKDVNAAILAVRMYFHARPFEGPRTEVDNTT